MFINFAEWLATTDISVTIQTVTWMIPLLQSIHIVTVGIVFVSVLLVALRVLGRAFADQPFGEVLARFSPWIGIGLVVMVITGLTLVVGEPPREFKTTSFWLKMALLIVAVSISFAFRRSFGPAHSVEPYPQFSGGTKKATVGVLLIWVAIIFLGRAIAYDTEVWQSLSLAYQGE